MADSSVYCACGAQWHGATITHAGPVIAAHRARWGTRINGRPSACGRLLHGGFRRRFRCYCAQCTQGRSDLYAARAARRAAKKDAHV
jgi:hypothetical protein